LDGAKMLALSASLEHRPTSIFRDGLGDRYLAADAATGQLTQVLRLPQAMTDVPAFEFALRERVTRLANFRHYFYVPAYRVERRNAPGGNLTLVSEHVEGIRLSDLLRVAHERQVDVDISTALAVIRQLLPATAFLHEHAPDVANGLIGPERLIVTPRGKIALAEQALCVAIEQLRYGPDRLWRELRIAVSPGARPVRFSHRTDVMNIGLVTLALVLGRPLRDDDFPDRIPMLIDAARERSALGYERRLSQPLRDWLARALQIDSDRSFASTPEAWLAFEEVVAADPLYLSTPIALEMFIYSCTAALIPPPASAAQPPAVTPPQPVAQLDHTPSPASALPHPAPQAVSEGEIHVEMLPAPIVNGPSQSTTPTDGIDWAAVADEPKAVATALDIKQLFNDADLLPRQEATAKPDDAFPALLVAPEPAPKAPPAPLTDAVPNEVSQPISAERLQARWPLQIARFTGSPNLRKLVIAAALVGLIAGVVAVMRFLNPAVVAASEMGTVVVTTSPAGLQVFVDGIDRGLTPARLSVSAGDHLLEVRSSGASRQLPFKVAGGTEFSQYLELTSAPTTGSLTVESEPGTTVLIDGQARGVTPLTVADLTPGAREVVLQTAAGSMRHTVTIQAGATASLNVPAVRSSTPSTTPSFGWLAVKTAFPVDVRLDGRVVGSSDAERIRMAAGRHEIELVNGTKEYRAIRIVTVVPGKVTSLALEPPPNGLLNLNALPWAEVWIGGRRIGETPLANVSVPLGRHEVVFRHPQLGEKRQGIAVTAGQPVRLSIDMK
jgi:hypothetical protein